MLFLEIFKYHLLLYVTYTNFSKTETDIVWFRVVYGV